MCVYRRLDQKSSAVIPYFLNYIVRFQCQKHEAPGRVNIFSSAAHTQIFIKPLRTAQYDNIIPISLFIFIFHCLRARRVIVFYCVICPFFYDNARCSVALTLSSILRTISLSLVFADKFDRSRYLQKSYI